VVDFILASSNVKERTVDFPTLKKVVRGVIPTPYDEEGGESEDTKQAPKQAASKEKKQAKSKGK